MEDISFLCCGSIGYALYVQYHPKIGNVWIRPDSEGNKVYTFSSLYNLIKEPLRSTTLWYPKNLDMNYYVFTSTVWGCLKGVSFLIS